MTTAPDVLVVGAGPTGLTLALQAHALGAAVRIIDSRPHAVRPSRAMLVHARTLEVLRPLGITEALMATARIGQSARLHLGRHILPVDLAELGLRGSHFPPLTVLTQMDVERAMARTLAERGVRVERGTELIGLACSRGDVRVSLRSPSGVAELSPRTVAGCDGVDSPTRHFAGIGWPGGSYRREVLLAEVDLDGNVAPGVIHVAAGRRGLVFAFPHGETASWRILATRPAHHPLVPPGQDGPPVLHAELQELLDDAGLDTRIARSSWSTRVRVQHRIADRYRQGPVFLAGDAAHAFSPAGGQGMNAGIQDAVNLGWKLALARSSTDPDVLLDSYEQERRPVARETLALTHLIFWAESSTDPVAARLRSVLAPAGGVHCAAKPGAQRGRPARAVRGSHRVTAAADCRSTRVHGVPAVFGPVTGCRTTRSAATGGSSLGRN